MFRKLTIKARLSFVIGLMSVLIGVIGGLGMKGMLDMERGLQTIYANQLLPSQQIGTINDLMRSDIESLYGMSLLDPRLNDGELDADGITDRTADIEANIEFTGQLWDAYMATERTAEERALAEDFEQLRRTYLDEGLLPAMRLYEAGQFDDANRLLRRDTLPAYEDAAFASQDLLSLQIEEAKNVYEAAQAQYAELRNVTLGAAIGGVLLALAVGWLIIRAIVRPAKHAIDVFQSIGQGRLDSEVEIGSDDEMGQILSNLKSMQERLSTRLDEERRQAEANRRISDALESVSGAVMISDADLTIIHANPSARALFAEHEEALRQDVPELSSENLVGSKISMFHPDPEQYAELLAGLEQSRTVTLELGGRTLRLVTSPVADDEGRRIGYVFEWTDKTDQVAAEREVAALVEAAASGDFGHRMDTAAATGFFRALGESVNRLVDVTGSNLAEV
ncbi:MAG: Tar ligand binding domain-containing protein, partial [Gammaproteobacteria bacterium]|nr:Tar ligand binding domain-containing protein [Gammaproteobacteria bacterium]